MMQIFTQEKLDGIADKLTNNCLSYTARAHQVVKDSTNQDIDLHDLIDGDQLAVANSNPSQEDLFYLSSILVSTGWNLNDDVFLPEYLWAARKTPEDKQFNFMHNDRDIIGHITHNEVVDGAGNIYSGDKVPEDFSILTNAVIYKAWSDPEQQERIENLIEGIQNNMWFVSMECLFHGFDYALKNDEEQFIMERNESSAFLTKYLRSYGGSGTYENYKIGRVLKKLNFSGKGLVDNPANPKSIILNDSAELSHAKEKYSMSDKDFEKLYNDAQNELAQVKAELIVAKQAETQIEALNTKLTEAETTVATKVSEIEALTRTLEESVANVTEKETELSTAKTELETSKAKVSELEKIMKTEARKSQMIEAGLSKEEIESHISTMESVSDEAFASVLTILKSKASSDDNDSIEDTLDDAQADNNEEDANEGDDGQEDAAASTRASMVSYFTEALTK